MFKLNAAAVSVAVITETPESIVYVRPSRKIVFWTRSGSLQQVRRALTWMSLSESIRELWLQALEKLWCAKIPHMSPFYALWRMILDKSTGFGKEGRMGLECLTGRWSHGCDASVALDT